MNEEISHYITTRYNLSLYSDRTERPGKIPDPDEWMEHRYKLFANFTYPSLQGQTCNNFTWYLFVDNQTPGRYKEQLEDLASSNMRIVYLKCRQVDFLKNEIKEAKDIVITSRIDNDDAWHKDYVKTIQTKYSRPTKLVEYAENYWLDVATKKVYRQDWRWYYRLNLCIGNNPTMVEWRDRAKTILVDKHTKLKKYFRYYQIKKITKKPYGLVVCHGRNVVNQTDNVASKATEVGLDVLDDFNIKPDMISS